MFDFEFDIQRFAEEATAPAEESAEQAQEATEIPPELDGIDDEDIARDIMEEAKELTGMQEAQQDSTQTETHVSDSAAPGPIPYARFKEKVDEGKRKDDEIAQLRQQLEAMKSQQQAPATQEPKPQATPQANPQPNPQPSYQPFQLTQENVALVNKAINDEAVKMAGLSQDDMDSLEYMEDDDPRKQRWQYAQEMARGNVFDRIRQAQAAQQAQANRYISARNASIAEFNEYAKAQMEEPDFEGVKNFAVNDFFNSLPSEAQKMTLASAYAKIERNVASPEDIYLVKDYFAQAKAAYRSQHPLAAEAKKTNRLEQAKSFPRSTQVAGSGDAGGGVTVASLEKMLNDTPWDQIDPKYQKMLLGD